MDPSRLPSSARAEYHDLLGTALQTLGFFQPAFRSLERAFFFYRKAGDKFGQRSVAHRLGDVERQLEKFSSALTWYERARRGTSARDSQNIDARMGTALALRGLGRYDDAIRLFQNLFHSYRSLKDTAGMAYALWAMGTTQRFAGHLVAAEKNLRKSISLYEKCGDVEGLSYARCGLGGTLRMRGKPNESEKLYAAANGYFVRSGDQFGTAYSFCGRSNALRMQGKLSASLPFMKKAEAIYRRLGQKGPLAFVLWSRSQLEGEKGRFATAKKALSEATRLFSSVQDPRGLLYCLLGRAELARRQNDDRTSRKIFGQAAKTARRLKLFYEEAHALQRLGNPRAASLYRRAGIEMAGFRRYNALP